MNKSAARIKYNMQIQLGLIDIGYSDYVQTIIQNMTNNPITITAGTALTQLLLIKTEYLHTNKIGLIQNHPEDHLDQQVMTSNKYTKQ